MTSRRTLTFALALVSINASCRYFRPVNPTPSSPSQGEEQQKPAEAAPTAAAQPDPQPVQAAAPPLKIGRVNDENIAAMLLASNNTDISYARLVPSRAQREDVMKFAERMLTDHNGVNALVTELVRKLDMEPRENVMSLDLRDESANRRDILRELSGFAFDSTYMDNEIAYHQRFLAVIDEIMLPQVRNGDLRNLLTIVRPAVAAHLAHAEQTRANVLAKK
jgi:putative membrane protein